MQGVWGTDGRCRTPIAEMSHANRMGVRDDRRFARDTLLKGSDLVKVMRRGPDKVVAAVTVVVALACAGQAWAEGEALVSTLPLTALDGDDATIEPHPVLGAMLIVGFSRESGEATWEWGMHIDRWGAERSGDEARPAAPHLPVESERTEDPMPVFSISVIGDVSRMMRGVLRRMMKGVMPEEVEGSFFLAYEEADAWRELASVEDEDAAYLLRIDPAGQICARHTGPASDEALEGLLDAPCSSETP